MNRTFSIYKVLIPLSLCLLTAFVSCKDKDDAKITNKDTVTADTNSKYVGISDSALERIFDKDITDFSARNNAADNWTMYDKDNKANAEKSLKGRTLVFPLFKEQIDYLHLTDVTDTVLVYYGIKSNTFVINITKGFSLFDNLKVKGNGLMAVKVNSIVHSQKLYLIKKYTDFQHKEKNVTEFYINAELLDAINVSAKDKVLKEKFKLE